MNYDRIIPHETITEMVQQVRIFSMYQRGEIEEAVARVFLGDHLDTMAADAEEVRAAINDDTSDLVQ
jgi:ribosomal protein L16/L10AE